MNLEKGKEVSKNATRREKRQLRRQNFRRKIRKRMLAKKLQEHGMFPATDNNDTTITMSRFNPEVSSFFQINPYECRAKAYKGDELILLELGRVLYHFSQRLGYKENLQSGSEEEGVIFEGKDGKIGINETRQKVQEYGTLGNHLAQVDTRQERLRNRYTTRQMYIDEFEEIWKKQSKNHPTVLTDELKKMIGDATDGLLFFQQVNEKFLTVLLMDNLSKRLDSLAGRCLTRLLHFQIKGLSLQLITGMVSWKPSNHEKGNEIYTTKSCR